MRTTDANAKNDTDIDCNTEATTPQADLTAFQRNILTVLADGDHYGLAIKDELEAYYGHHINHGRLYPNIDDLANKGLVEKSERDKRTNNYSLTQAGRDALEDDLDWRLERITSGDEEGGA